MSVKNGVCAEFFRALYKSCRGAFNAVQIAVRGEDLNAFYVD